MNNLAEVCPVGLGGGNYIRWLVISMGLGGAKVWGGFKVIILRGGGLGQATERGSVFIGRLDTSIHHEGCSHYVKRLF